MRCLRGVPPKASFQFPGAGRFAALWQQRLENQSHFSSSPDDILTLLNGVIYGYDPYCCSAAGSGVCPPPAAGRPPAVAAGRRQPAAGRRMLATRRPAGRQPAWARSHGPDGPHAPMGPVGPMGSTGPMAPWVPRNSNMRQGAPEQLSKTPCGVSSPPPQYRCIRGVCSVKDAHRDKYAEVCDVGV